MTDRVRRRVLIAGRVQGVCFRQYAADEAVALGVSGWVRNLHDGRVEAVFEGPAELVDVAVAWCNHGPPHAAVDSVEAFAEEPEGLTGFSLRY